MEARRRASTTDHAGGWPEGTARPPPTAPCGSTGRAGPPRHPWRLVSQKSLAAHIRIFQRPGRENGGLRGFRKARQAAGDPAPGQPAHAGPGDRDALIGPPEMRTRKRVSHDPRRRGSRNPRHRVSGAPRRRGRSRAAADMEPVRFGALWPALSQQRPCSRDRARRGEAVDGSPPAVSGGAAATTALRQRQGRGVAPRRAPEAPWSNNARGPIAAEPRPARRSFHAAATLPRPAPPTPLPVRQGTSEAGCRSAPAGPDGGTIPANRSRLACRRRCTARTPSRRRATRQPSHRAQPERDAALRERTGRGCDARKPRQARSPCRRTLNTPIPSPQSPFTLAPGAGRGAPPRFAGRP